MNARIKTRVAEEFENPSLVGELKMLVYPFMELEVGHEFIVDLEGFEDKVQRARQFIWMRKPKGTNRCWTSKIERPAEGSPKLHVIRLK
jgi:hypothetical protein